VRNLQQLTDFFECVCTCQPAHLYQVANLAVLPYTEDYVYGRRHVSIKAAKG
jgi:hypothetical protein